MHESRRHPQRGVTLAEFCVALALAALAAGIATPALASFHANARRQAAAAELRRMIALIRGEAIRRGSPVGAVLTSPDGEPWFQLFADGNANGITAADRRDGIDPPLGPPRRLSPQARLLLTRPPGDEAGDAITFRGETITFSPLGTFSNGTLYLGDGREHLRARLHGTSGRIHFERRLAARDAWQEVLP